MKITKETIEILRCAFKEFEKIIMDTHQWMDESPFYSGPDADETQPDISSYLVFSLNLFLVEKFDLKPLSKHKIDSLVLHFDHLSSSHHSSHHLDYKYLTDGAKKCQKNR